MNDWKQLFKPQILERGYEYFCDDTVDCITKNRGTYMATVHGSEGYHVQIKISKEKVKEMYCDCPFAAVRRKDPAGDRGNGGLTCVCHRSIKKTTRKTSFFAKTLPA